MDFKNLITKLDTIASKKILLETERLTLEAPNNDADELSQRYGSDSYVATAARDSGNNTNDPLKPNPPKPKPGMSGNAGTRAFQHWLNSKGIKVAVDGKWGSETATGNQKYFDTYVVTKKITKAQQDEYEDMRGVGTAHNVRATPGSGNMYIGSPEYIAAMNKYGYDPKTGNPVGGAKSDQSKIGQGTQPTDPNAAASAPTDAKSKAMAISKAISGAGTDERAVYGVLDTIKNAEEFNQIAAAYKAAWGGSKELGAELVGDFSGYELLMLNSKLKKVGIMLDKTGQIVPTKAAAESVELDTIKFLSGLN